MFLFVLLNLLAKYIFTTLFEWINKFESIEKKASSSHKASSGASAANTTFTKNDMPLDDDSTEMLAHLALNSPQASGAGSNNSHSGSLGASISDLSSEAASEFSDMGGAGSSAAAAAALPPKPNGKKISPAKSIAMNSDLPSGASTPTKSSSGAASSSNSRLPIPKKN